MPRATVTRRLHVNAAHRLWNPEWSPADHDRGWCGACALALQRAGPAHVPLWETDRNHVDDAGG